MLFNSYGFILAFLPIALLLYYTANRLSRTFGQTLLLILSIIFISFNGFFHSLVALLSTLFNFGFYTLIRRTNGIKAKKYCLAAGLIFNIATLIFFKYASFGGAEIPLPIGISFYTFQQIAFLVDAFRDPASEIRLLDYSLFTMFFPKLLQGPIPYAGEIIPQLVDTSRKKIHFDNLSKGIYLFAIGLAKKVLLADNFSIVADYGYQNIVSLNSYEALLTILSYTFQLYFDFAGYSDMAIGIGYMFNIEIPVNFDSPYKALNITDFWKRWHITLTRFLTKYIYIPLGGNRRGLLRTFLNIIVVYLVSGLWHGSGFTFLVWGLLHAVASILYRIFKKTYDSFPVIVQWVLQFSFINISWVFFRADTFSNALALLKQVWIGGWSLSINVQLTESLLQPTFFSVLSRLLSFDLTIVLCFGCTLLLVLFTKNSNVRAQKFQPSVSTWLTAYFLLVTSILSLAGVSSFLYTNF